MKITEEGFQSFISTYEKKHGPCPPPVLPLLRDFFMAGVTVAFFRYHSIINSEGPPGETDDQLFVRTRDAIEALHGEVVGYAVDKLLDAAKRRQTAAGRN